MPLEFFSLCACPQAEEMEDEKQLQSLTNAGKYPLDCWWRFHCLLLLLLLSAEWIQVQVASLAAR